MSDVKVTNSTENEQSKRSKIIKGLALLGPGLITAATVLGPGSITVSSKSGALMGYSILWVLLVSAIFMITFMVMSAKIGCLTNETFCTTVTKRYGKWVSVLIGLSKLFIGAGFQTGNALGIGLALDALFGGGVALWAVIFLGISIILLWSSRDFFKMLEKVMMILVLTMMVAFLGNLFKITPDFGGIASGFIPSKPAIWGLVIAISATSFSVGGAQSQAYLVQFKGWKKEQLNQGLKTAITGTLILCGISMIIMITAATVLAPKGIAVTSAVDMAIQLEPLLGSLAKWLFLIGLLAAAFSSYMGNAVMNSLVFADSLNLGSTFDSKAVKIVSTCMLVGSTLLAAIFGSNPVQLLVMAQGLTILGTPLIAIVVFMMANDKKIVGKNTNKLIINIVAVLAILWILYLSYNKIVGFIG